MHIVLVCVFFFFNDTATTEIYTLSLHDALPISLSFEELRRKVLEVAGKGVRLQRFKGLGEMNAEQLRERSEEHTSELQSRQYLVCRLLLEKKNHVIQLVKSTDSAKRIPS